MRPGDELRQNVLERKREIDFGAPIGKALVHSPDELIVYRLLYFSLIQQTKHLRDKMGIILSIGIDLDKEYIAQRAREKAVFGIWEEILFQVENMD